MELQLHQRSPGASMDTQYTFDRGPNNPPTSVIFGPEYLAAKLYQLSPPEVSYSVVSFLTCIYIKMTWWLSIAVPLKTDFSI